MQKILDKLSTFMVKPKTKREKMAYWFGQHENLYTFGGIITIIISGFILFPLIQKFIFPPDIHIDLIGCILSCIISMMPLFLIWGFGGITLSQLKNESEKKYKQKYQNNVLNYLENNLEDKEIKEFLLKIKLITLHKEIINIESNFTPEFETYVSNLEDDTIDSFYLNHTTKIITKNFSNYQEKNHSLLEKSVDELKDMISKQIANQLKKERDSVQKRDQYIEKFADNDEFLFQKAKTLKTNL
jgi:hypothetical protein